MGNRILGQLGNAAFFIRHPDEALLFGGQQPDNRGLHNGHQSHIAVGCHHDGTEILGVEGVCHKDGSGAVRCTDDSNGRGILQVKEEARQKQGEKDTELCRRTKEHQPRLFQQRAKIDHGTNADEEQQREQLVGHARIKQSGNWAYRIALRNGARQGQVDQNGTKAHG